jgi:sugar lactone lactonase YvrE
VYRIAPDGQLRQVLTDLAGPERPRLPSPDEKILYVVESPGRRRPEDLGLRARGTDGTLSNKPLAVDAQGPAGAFDGASASRASPGNLWCGYPAATAPPTRPPPRLDGVVRVFAPDGAPLDPIPLLRTLAPTSASAGATSNRLFMPGGKPFVVRAVREYAGRGLEANLAA